MEEKKKKIVMFEDEVLLSEMYKNHFEKEGFEFKLFERAPENLIETIIKEKPDIISMDIILPGLNGYEITKKIKADPRIKDIPIIGFDNLGGKEYIEKAINSGMEDYYIKADQTPSEYVKNIKTYVESPKEYKCNFKHIIDK